MARLEFTANIQRHVACPAQTLEGTTVRQILEAAFALNPRLRTYVLDDQGGLRRHMNVFVDGVAITDRCGLSDAVGTQSAVYVFQALSGG